MTDPFQHSDVAVAIYRIISDFGLDDQEAEGKLACLIADMLGKDFDLELQPPVEGDS